MPNLHFYGPPSACEEPEEESVHDSLQLHLPNHEESHIATLSPMVWRWQLAG